MMLSAAIGALLNGWLPFRLGRKYSLMNGAVLLVVGSLGSAFASIVEVLIGARVILGVAIGIASYTAPLYLYEMESKNVRSKMNQYVSINGDVEHCAGFFIRYGIQLQRELARDAGGTVLSAVLLIILVVFLPNSPRWLAQKGHHIEEEEVLRMVHDTSEKARDELNKIQESFKIKQGGWSLFKANRNVCRAMFLGMLLQAMQQLTGMNIIMYYCAAHF